MDSEWVAPPDTTTTYAIFNFSGTCASPPIYTTERTAILNTTMLPRIDNFFNGCIIRIVKGDGKSQSRIIDSYDQATGQITVTEQWKITPNTTSKFVICGEGGLASGGTLASITLGGASEYVAAGHWCQIIAGVNNGRSYALSAATPTVETTTLTITESLDGDYFVLEDEAGDSVAFWVDEDDSGTAEPSHGADRSVEITTLTSGMSSQAAAAIALAVNADRSFVAYASGSAVTVKSLLTGTRTAATDNGGNIDATVATAGTTLTAQIGSERWGCRVTRQRATVSSAGGPASSNPPRGTAMPALA